MLAELKKFYKKNRRDLPWRHTTEPYRILVSEVMLQQTQVARVVPYYKKFIKKFPTARSLGAAPLREVLAAWQGLGYNRRAKYLRDAAKIISSATEEFFPSSSDAQKNSSAAELSVEFLESLPGVGPYTARAVAAFVYNKPTVFIETNIRTVFFHHIGGNKKMSDAQLLPLIAETLKKSKMEPREFYWMLMDYGAYLKRQGVNLNARSAHYVKQPKFEGSRRQKRAAELRNLLASGASEDTLRKLLDS